MTEDLICTVPIPETQQELEQAIKRYKASDPLNSDELFCQWQAIRQASLAQQLPELESDRVPGEDSY
jgi:hypothetical protein